MEATTYVSDIPGVSHLVVHEVTFRKGKENPGITAKFWRLENELVFRAENIGSEIFFPAKKKKKKKCKREQHSREGGGVGYGVGFGRGLV